MLGFSVLDFLFPFFNFSFELFSFFSSQLLLQLCLLYLLLLLNIFTSFLILLQFPLKLFKLLLLLAEDCLIFFLNLLLFFLHLFFLNHLLSQVKLILSQIPVNGLGVNFISGFSSWNHHHKHVVRSKSQTIIMFELCPFCDRISIYIAT